MDAPYDVGGLARRIEEQVGRVTGGEETVIELLLVVPLSEGYVLLEDAPAREVHESVWSWADLMAALGAWRPGAIAAGRRDTSGVSVRE